MVYTVSWLLQTPAIENVMRYLEINVKMEKQASNFE